jgi:hypothetical protein
MLVPLLHLCAYQANYSMGRRPARTEGLKRGAKSPNGQSPQSSVAPTLHFSHVTSLMDHHRIRVTLSLTHKDMLPGEH